MILQVSVMFGTFLSAWVAVTSTALVDILEQNLLWIADEP
jgi:hypothetical protein